MCAAARRPAEPLACAVEGDVLRVSRGRTRNAAIVLRIIAEACATAGYQVEQANDQRWVPA